MWIWSLNSNLVTIMTELVTLLTDLVTILTDLVTFSHLFTPHHTLIFPGFVFVKSSEDFVQEIFLFFACKKKLRIICAEIHKHLVTLLTKLVTLLTDLVTNYRNLESLGLLMQKFRFKFKIFMVRVYFVRLIVTL